MLNLELTELEKLAIIRKKKGISQETVANELSVKQSYISYFENGKRRFDEFKYNQYKRFILEYPDENQTDAS